MSVINVVWSEPSCLEFTDGNFPTSYGNFIGYQPFEVAATYYESGYSNSGFSASLNTNKIFVPSAVALSDFWLHFSVYTAAPNALEQGTTPTDGVASIVFYSGTTPQFKIGRGNGSSTQWYFLKSTDSGVTWTQVGTFAVIPSEVLMSIDIHVKVDATIGEYQIYKDTVLLDTFTGDTSCTAGSINNIALGSGVERNTVGNNIYSQIILADENTVGWKVASLTVTADVAPVTFLGDWTRVNALTYTGASDKGVASNTPNDEVLFEVSSAPTNSLVIDSVWTSARKRKTWDSVPQKTLALMKLGAVVYTHPTSDTSSDDSEKVTKVKWSANPSNSSGWTASDVSALKIGYKVLV